MFLYILCAAETEKSSILYPEDHMRPLTVEGEKTARIAAEELAARVPRGFDRIVFDGMLRSRQTADIVAAATRFVPNPEAVRRMAEDHPPAAILARLGKTNNTKSMLLIGDAAAMAKLAAHVITGDSDCKLEMEPGSLARIETDDLRKRNGILSWMIPGFMW